MSTSSNDPSERRRVSKVTFSPISSELLVVRIRKMSTEVNEEDIPKVSSAFSPFRGNRNSADLKESANHSASSVADEQGTTSSSSRTTCGQQKDSNTGTDVELDSTPCLKHASLNISRRALEVPSEKVSLCNNCSKSMLSYIFLVQDFLDSLANEIGGKDSSRCLQCAREEVRSSASNLDARGSDSPNIVNDNVTSNQKHSECKSNSTEPKRDAPNDRPHKRSTRTKNHRQEIKRNEEHQKRSSNPSLKPFTNQQSTQVDFLYNISPSTNVSPSVKRDGLQNLSNEIRVIKDQQSSAQNIPLQQETVSSDQTVNQQATAVNQSRREPETKDTNYREEPASHYSPEADDHRVAPPAQSVAEAVFKASTELMRQNYDSVPNSPKYQAREDYSVQRSPTLFRDDVDGIVSALSNTEREIYDSARNRAGWESLTEPQERLGPPPGNLVVSEAFVTFCRNNAEAIGCLALGTSLLLCRTSKTLCVLVSEGVSTAFRGALSSVFQVVQYVRSLDSLGTTKLALLEQPELGITFDKLNIWRLAQFTKCVYLNPDTLVIQNCDELFSHEELSAVPDIGWPDCFNSGVFVFSPSVHTFWHLLEFAEKQGSYDGGDQGLLNSYFNSWSSDIGKKLSFIYNLMANVSYTYTPAFRQFGRNVKIVQFHGSFKPWHVKFFTNTGQVSPSSPVHPTYIQFVHIWLNIFRISVLRHMSQEIQSYAASQETICAVEILRFFPLPLESESEFFLTPPSVRLRLAEKKLSKSSISSPEVRRRKSAEVFRFSSVEDESAAKPEKSEAEVLEPPKSDDDCSTQQKLEDSCALDAEDVFKAAEMEEKLAVGVSTLPGSEVGDYQGMKAWEQGRMDYQGTDRSDNVIKRLQFLMSRPK